MRTCGSRVALPVHPSGATHNTLIQTSHATHTSTQAAAIQWPEIFVTEAAEAAKPDLVEKMRAVRPVVETG